MRTWQLKMPMSRDQWIRNGCNKHGCRAFSTSAAAMRGLRILVHSAAAILSAAFMIASKTTRVGPSRNSHVHGVHTFDEPPSTAN